MGWIWCPIACRLTWRSCSWFSFCPVCAFEVAFADVVAGCRALVLRAFRASGAWPGGPGRGCGSTECLADNAESPPAPGGGHGARGLAPLQGQPQVRGQCAGEPQLGVSGDDDPGPPVRGG